MKCGITEQVFFIKASAEGDAVAANVLAGKTFSNDADTGLVGTMPNNAGQALMSPVRSGTTLIVTPVVGYYNGTTATVAIDDPDLIASNIKAGVDIFGVTGTLKRSASGSGTTDASSVASVSGIGFVPSLIVVTQAYSTDGYRKVWQSGFNPGDNAGRTLNAGVAYISTSSAGMAMQGQETTYNWTVGSGTFSTKMILANKAFNWYAFE